MSDRENFTAEISHLRDYFQIPGLSVIITQRGSTIYENYIGYADLENKVPMDSITVIPMASLTKMFTGRMIRGFDRRVLEQPINKYVSLNPSIPDSIKIKHVLSHTSQGDAGKHFYYSSRFSWLTTTVEGQYQISFHDFVNDSIIAPSSLKHTFLIEDSIDLVGRKFAKPYFFEGETKPGFIDYGFSAASGITSTVRDLAKFSRQLDNTPDFPESYNYGLFKQVIRGEKILWAYGQYDCYSSLFIKIPGRDITCVIAANNSLMSDPARLIYGDMTTSLFALSFLHNFIFEDAESGKLIEDEVSLRSLEKRKGRYSQEFLKRKLIAQGVAESFLGRYDARHAENSAKILRRLFELFPEYDEYGDLTLLHNLIFLKLIAANTGQAEPTEFDKQIKAIGLKLLKDDPLNPYANYYLADYYRVKNNDSARLYFRRIAEAKNFSRNWYTNEAEEWLKEN